MWRRSGKRLPDARSVSVVHARRVGKLTEPLGRARDARDHVRQTVPHSSRLVSARIHGRAVVAGRHIIHPSIGFGAVAAAAAASVAAAAAAG